MQREPPEARRLRVAFPPERAAGEKGGRRGRRGAPLLSLCLSSATSRGSLLSGGGRARADGRRGRFGGWGRDSGLNSLELTHSRGFYSFKHNAAQDASTEDEEEL